MMRLFDPDDEDQAPVPEKPIKRRRPVDSSSRSAKKHAAAASSASVAASSFGAMARPAAADAFDWRAASAAADSLERESDQMFGSGLLIQSEEKESIKDQWEFAPFDHEDWSDIVDEESDDPDYCYLCACTQSDKELEGNPNLKLFLEFLWKNYAKMRRKTLAIQGLKVYNQLLRPNTLLKKVMRAKTIIDHLEKHAPTTRIQLEHMNRTLNSCIMEQSKQLRQREIGTRNTRLSAPHVNTYLKLAAFQNEVSAKLSKVRPDERK